MQGDDVSTRDCPIRPGCLSDFYNSMKPPSGWVLAGDNSIGFGRGWLHGGCRRSGLGAGGAFARLAWIGSSRKQPRMAELYRVMRDSINTEIGQSDKKSYYAVIPASVRYDQSLCPNAKLLFGEITALCNEKGYCWARNSYFVGLYEKSPRTISRWISQLIEAGYIRAENNQEAGNRRRLYIETGMSIGADKNVHTPPDRNVHQNNKDIVLLGNKIGTPITDLSEAAAEGEGRQLLILEGVHPKVADSLTRAQKHPEGSIRNAIANAKSRRGWLAFTDPFRAKLFNVAGYIVASVNIARREGHSVELSNRSKALQRLSEDKGRKREPLSEIEIKAAVQRQKATLGLPP